MRDEIHAEDLLRDAIGVVRIVRELHAAAFAAAACMDLRFHDNGAATETLSDASRVGRVEHGLTRGDRHTVTRENGLGLILVNFHQYKTPNRSVRCLSASSVCE